MVQKIIDIHNPILRKKAKKIEKIDKKIAMIIQSMKDTLKDQKDPEGVGLAAPQIGKNMRIFLIDYKSRKEVFINPEIVSLDTVHSQKISKDTEGNQILEGCLSLPHYYGPVKRAQAVTLKYQNEEGKHLEEKFTGFLAHIVQHEMDHLDGTLFVDRILEQNSKLYLFDGDEWEEVTIR